MNNKFYLICIKDLPQVASAFAPESTKLAHDLIDDLEDLNELPFDLNLVKLFERNGELAKSDYLGDLQDIWLDYQPNSLAWPLFSERLKNIIEQIRNDQDEFDWILAKVNGNNERRNYYILRFQRMYDVLDVKKTMYVPGTRNIIKPYFSLQKVRHLTVFTTPSEFNLWKIKSRLYINDNLRRIIQREKLTGITFEKARVKND
ncbi:hypothetical protein SAMN05192529_11130 [Arachidicoccus rhizosphaerae]|uniref:Immunity MXAN-0049 protein domain-containing protein n=1 Tax=Arachidicoccus rhizosphaerae TaxID=551991 RepID=A0A1H3ZI79_9BACT|nr:DUF1629 domain-containing protein [Arachidicoccus rhizosphaerae]SEA23131.1 hypothetical protein SAMN05192529_11130 [Arachidicoccus rhizosphaerae]